MTLSVASYRVFLAAVASLLSTLMVLPAMRIARCYQYIVGRLLLSLNPSDFFHVVPHCSMCSSAAPQILARFPRAPFGTRSR